jgi:hypothetical protein
MSEKRTRMNPLASRKNLLVAESDLNRAQLVQDWQTMAGEARALKNQARTISSLASAAAVLVSGIASLRRKHAAPVDEKPSWLKTILKGVQLAGSFWSELRTRPK